MLNELKSEIRNIKPGRADLRKFGLILSSLVLIWTIWFAVETGLIFMIAVILLFAVSIFLPEILKYIYLSLMFFATVIGFFLFRALLTIIFFMVLTPIRFLAYGAGKNKFPDPEADSYWKKI